MKRGRALVRIQHPLSMESQKTLHDRANLTTPFLWFSRVEHGVLTVL